MLYVIMSLARFGQILFCYFHTLAIFEIDELLDLILLHIFNLIVVKQSDFAHVVVIFACFLFNGIPGCWKIVWVYFLNSQSLEENWDLIRAYLRRSLFIIAFAIGQRLFT